MVEERHAGRFNDFDLSSKEEHLNIYFIAIGKGIYHLAHHLNSHL
jgi:hypothetical protein